MKRKNKANFFEAFPVDNICIKQSTARGRENLLSRIATQSNNLNKEIC